MSTNNVRGFGPINLTPTSMLSNIGQGMSTIGMQYQNVINGTWPSKGKTSFGMIIATQSGTTYGIYKRGIGTYKDTFRLNAPYTSTSFGGGYAVACSSNSRYIAVGVVNSPYIVTYKRNGDTFTQLNDPDVLPAGASKRGNAIAFSPDDKYMACMSATSPYLKIYKLDKSTDSFTKIADPAVMPTIGNSYSGVAFSPNGNYLAITQNDSPNIAIYKITAGDTFTRLPNPTTLPSGPCHGVAFSPDGVYMVLSSDTSPYINVYKITSGDTFTKLTDPVATGTSLGYAIAFSPDGNYVVIGGASSSVINVYQRSGDTFTKLANNNPNTTAVIGISISPDGYVICVGTGTPCHTIFKLDTSSASGMTKLPDLSVDDQPPTTTFGCAFIYEE
jgi:WD40 repeat protein